MSKETVAVLQSNYIPWKGYFDIINDVDLFVFYDEVQYTKNDWRNRNKIYSLDGLKWLTLPCGYDLKRRINEVMLNPSINWQQDHFNMICASYEKASYFAKFRPFFEQIYLESEWEYLSEINQYLIKYIATEFLGSKTIFANSEDYESHGKRSEKLLSLICATGYKRYVTGPAAKDYIDENAFFEQGIEIICKDYSGYPEYHQTRVPFEHNVSIIDLLVNTGDEAPYYIWGWRQDNK